MVRLPDVMLAVIARFADEVMLPVVVKLPVYRLADVMLPWADMIVVITLPEVMLPTTLRLPEAVMLLVTVKLPVYRLADVMLPRADMIVVITFPDTILPDADILPVLTLATVMLPDDMFSKLPVRVRLAPWMLPSVVQPVDMNSGV